MDHRIDRRIQIAMFLRKLGQLGARGNFIGADNTAHVFFFLRLLATSSPQRFMSGQS